MKGWTRRKILAAGLVLPGITHGAGRGTRVQQPEVELEDELTGRDLTRLTDPGVLVHFPHYHHRFLVGDGRALLVGAESGGTRQIHFFDLRRKRMTQLSDGPDVFPYSATLAAEEREIFFLQGDGLVRTSLRGRGGRRVFRRSSGWVFTGHLSVAPGGERAAMVEMREEDFRNDPAEQFAARPQCRIRFVDLVSGKDQVVVTERGWIVHPQLRPRRSELLYSLAGPPGELGLELKFVSLADKKPRDLVPTEGGRVDRPYWASGGAEIRFIHYPGDNLRGSTIRAISPDTGDEQKIARCSAFGWLDQNADGSAFVGASRRPSGPNVYVLFPRLDREITLCEHGASGKSYPVAGSERLDVACSRPEVVFVRDSQEVLFVSDRDGQPAVYRMNVEDLVEAT